MHISYYMTELTLRTLWLFLGPITSGKGEKAKHFNKKTTKYRSFNIVARINYRVGSKKNRLGDVT